MPEIELSLMAHGPDTASDLRPFLAQFEDEHHVQVKTHALPWETGWTELVKFALYGHGPDVSEVGSTWVGNLAATNALRPYSVREMAAVGGRYAFLHPSWQSGFLTGEPQMWAIPWLANVRFVYYRRDWLQQAGIDPRTAFQSPQQFEATLQQLQAAGIARPWVIPTRDTVNTLHTAALWVWGAGGNFTDLEGKRTSFNEPPARAGLRAYFELARYLALAARNLNTDQADELFLQGQAAITISDPGLLHALQHGQATPETSANTCTALPPGVPFVGGSNLVVWRHTRQEKIAADLVRFLTSLTVQIGFSPQVRGLPVRLEALERPPFSTDPLYTPIVDGLKTGRSYKVDRLWGLVEDKLVAELNQIWQEIFTQPNLNLDAALDEHLGPLSERLDATLAGDIRRF